MANTGETARKVPLFSVRMLSGGTDFAKLNVICIGACAVRSFCSLFKKTMVIRSKWHSKVIASLHDWLPA